MIGFSFLRGKTDFITILSIAITSQACMKFRTSDTKTLAYFDKQGIKVSVKQIDFKGKSIHYIESSDNLKKDEFIVMFVHGAPGSSDNFHKYLADNQLREKARLIAVDRLGYGYSEYGSSEISLAEQAAALYHIIRQYDSNKIILVGHSYGGPIVAKIAMEYPTKITAVIMLAPAIDPDNEKMFWVSYIGKWKPVKWILSDALKVATDEKFSHSSELEKLREKWKDLQIPIIHIHGRKDKIVPYENVNFSKININPIYLNVIDLADANHFILWNRFSLIKKEILGIFDSQTNY